MQNNEEVNCIESSPSVSVPWTERPFVKDMYLLTVKWTDIQTGRYADEWMDSLTVGWTDRQTNGWTDRQMNGQTDRQTNGWAAKWMDKIYGQINKLTDI